MLVSEDQIQELYEINDDPKRKEFLDDLFSFMQKRGTPINRLPIMAKSVLDLYELYNLVIARGGLVDVINKKLWQEIIKGLHLPSSITSAAFTLRTQYMKYLYPYECEKKNLSTPSELQAAIDGNRREGRRSSYGQYEAMHSQMQMPPMARQSLPGGMQQISPLALVTHAANSQQAQAAAAAAAHHRLMTPSFGQVPNIVTQEIEQRMIEYLKLIQVKKEQNAVSNGSGVMGLSPHQQHQRSQSPEISTREALNALEMSRVALWQMYHNNTSPPASVNASPQGGENTNSPEKEDAVIVGQRSEALNLANSTSPLNSIKREREPSPEFIQHAGIHNRPPPPKRVGFPPTTFYLPSATSNIGAAAVKTNYHCKEHDHDLDTEADEENDDDDNNTTAYSSHDNPIGHQHLNGSTLRAPRHHGSNGSVHNDKSDDSAIENSPSTSAASAGNGHISPVSRKKTHLSKQTQPQYNLSNANTTGSTCADRVIRSSCSTLGPHESLNLFSGMQFRLTRNGANSSGNQELVAHLELDGVKYSGVLIANTSNLGTETVTPMTTVSSIGENCFSNKNINNQNKITNCRHKDGSHSRNSNEASNDIVVVMNAIEDTSELTMRDTEIQPNSPTTRTTTNCSNSSTNALQDASITS